MRWHKTALERKYIWPYIVAENSIKVAIQGKSLNNGETKSTWQTNNWKPSDGKIINSDARWDIFNEQVEWERLNIELSVSIDNFQEILAQVMPDDLISSHIFTLTVLCQNTRYRFAKNSEMTDGKAHITIDLHRKDVAGEITLSPTIILSNDAENSSSTKAKFKGARVVTGFPINIFVDEPEDKPGGGIEIKWKEFNVNIANALYELEFNNEGGYKPTININNRHPEIKTIVDSKAKGGEKARIRDSLFGSIALDVWMQLAEFSAKINEEENEEMDPQAILAEKILKTLSKRMNCTKREIIDSFDDPGSRRLLNLKIQNWLKILERERKLINEVKEEIMEE